MKEKHPYIRYIDILVMSFIFLLLFLLPVIFTREQGRIAWPNVFKIWQDRVLLLPLFFLNHLLLVPGLVLKKKYSLYIAIITVLIAGTVTAYYFIDEYPSKPAKAGREARYDERVNQPGRPGPGPPYADLLLFSLLVISVDTGLRFTIHWHKAEEEKLKLEQENIRAQLGMLRHQVSPHFFMNTLNNIYSLIESDKGTAREVVMKLSKLMRYLLYENREGKVLLSREFDFIRSYCDLMKLRFTGEVRVGLSIPENYTDCEIPVLLFLSYIENAFRYGASYEKKSSIDILFSASEDSLFFTCLNTNNRLASDRPAGIGLENSRKRLDLLYGSRYSLIIDENPDLYSVSLKIPLL